MNSTSLKQVFAKIGMTAAIGLSAATLLSAGPVLAANNPFQAGQNMANDVAGSAGITTSKTLPQIIGQIINIVLSFLGMVFLILVLYAGFLWMTAQGEAKNVDKAKSILSQSIIGLIVIVAGFAISNFVLGSLVQVTQQ